MNGWISVDERLPKLMEYVIVLEDDHICPNAYYWGVLSYKDKYQPQRIRPAQLRSIDEEGNATWQLTHLASGHPVGEYKNVTYWKPLPVVEQDLVKPRPE